MKIQLLKDYQKWGAGTVLDVAPGDAKPLIDDATAVQVPDDTRARKYPLGAKIENLCVPLNDNVTITAPPQFIASIEDDLNTNDTAPKQQARRQFFNKTND
jgi:hypothetical protein